MGSHASSTEHLAATENYQKTTAAAARDNGYRMLMCQKLNAMHFLANGLALPQEHGTLKMPSKTRGGRRKRTKKRALKKRHRTKRKRRKRRKRTRKRKRKTRRKRGGKHKLSNKKCKMLRHQHSKLIHHVNMVGKALRVQCKKRL
jgi:transposase